MDSPEVLQEAPPTIPTHGRRSPAYPRVLLSLCLDYVRKLDMANAYGYDVPFKAVASILGLGNSLKSDRFRSVISSLKYFGFAETRETENGWVLRLTEPAHRFASDRRIDSPERDHAIRRAALKPKVYRALWDEWQAKGVPPHDVLEHQLEHEYGFNRNSIEGFLADFRANAAFAGLAEASAPLGTVLPDGEGDASETAPTDHGTEREDSDLEAKRPNQPRDSTPPPQPPRPPTPGRLELVIVLDEANRAIVQVPEDLTEKGFMLLDHGLRSALDHLALRHGFERRL